MQENQFQDISPAKTVNSYSPEHVSSGITIPKVKRIQIISSEDWEHFVEEWATTLNSKYHRVGRFAGAGDMGLDIVGYHTEKGFLGKWDNYQCKHYDHPLTPSDIWVEIGKIIYYSFINEYTKPTIYYFIASNDIGTKLQRLLGNSDKLKAGCKENWDKCCKSEITSTLEIKLEGDFETYFDAFDFAIFSTKSVIDLINEHSNTPFHSVRFGGGLPARPNATNPPSDISVEESRYIQQVIDAYGDHHKESAPTLEWVKSQVSLTNDFNRQRERFYHAESLRNFSRDTVPEGTFEELQKDIFDGVVDTCESEFSSGFERMREVMTQSAQLPITSNPLLSVIRPKDKQGICHQLANTDKLKWLTK